MGAARSRLVGGAPAWVTKLWEVGEEEVLFLRLQAPEAVVRFEHKVESVDCNNQIE